MCGILGIIGSFTIPIVLKKLALLQHRGNESYGYHCDNQDVCCFQGKISPVVSGKDIHRMAIAHTRYSTSGNKNNQNLMQPMRSDTFTLVHNGNIPQYRELAATLGLHLDSESDTELLVKYIESKLSKGNCLKDALIGLLSDIKGAYSILIKTKDGLYAIRDRFGVRPLCVGRNDNGFYYSSETVALTNCYPLGDVMRGSIVFCDGIEQTVLYKLSGTGPPRICTFEEIYFKNHRSYNTYNKRFQMGYELGLTEKSVIPLIVVCLPNTAITCAEGYATATNLEFRKDWIQKANSDRTFIQPTDTLRIDACNKSYIINQNLKGKSIYLVDDSIVRGHTMRSIIKSLRDVGVVDIHVRICSPLVVESCQYGIDIPSRIELIGHGRTVDEICTIINANSLRYLPRSTVEDICTRGCTQCFGGDLLW
jgi:amidophosphoribosyltransferase